MKKELEAQLAAAKSESKATVEALKRELYAVTEERDKLKARCQQVPMLYVCYVRVFVHVLLYICVDTNVCALRWRGTCGTQRRTRMLTYADICADGKGHGGLYDELEQGGEAAQGGAGRDDQEET